MNVRSPFVSVVLFLIAILSYPTSYAVEINELDEITMQVIDFDDNDKIVIQQMIKIPLPAIRSNRISPAKSYAKTSITHRESSKSKLKSNTAPN